MPGIVGATMSRTARRQRHHPEPHPGELTLLGAHLALEVALELVRTVGPRLP